MLKVKQKNVFRLLGETAKNISEKEASNLALRKSL
jgi:hypothetical protein